MQKILLFIPFTLLAFISCKTPDIVMQNGNLYSVANWQGGEFVYVTYKWKGGSFNKAVELVKYFNQVVIDRNEGEEAIAILPTKTTWKIGFIAKSPFELSEIHGHTVLKENVPAGKYATMRLKGYPDFMFTHYKKFSKQLKKDGYKVVSPVFEIYTYDTFNNPLIPPENKIGEIRYRISG